MVVRINRISFLGLGSVEHDRMIDHYKRVIGLPVAYETSSELFLACGIGHHAIHCTRIQRAVTDMWAWRSAATYP